MSRAALWRQEGNVKERERRAEEIYQTVVEEGVERAARSKSALPIWGGPDRSFHFNPLLFRNTLQSSYFQKCCQHLMDWNAIIDEIYYEVQSLQPFASGGGGDKTPSSAFCLLLRLLTLRMTDHQLDLTLKHVDSPYIRAIGFMYLRYGGPPDQIISWIQPYLYDSEELTVEASGKQQKHNQATTMGQFVRDLFRSRDFHGTPLPRFPLDIERSIQVLLLQAEKVAERAAKHKQNTSLMAHFQTVGSEVMALYGDDENPVTWYKAVIDRVITRDEQTGATLFYPKFVVTFPEYGNTETVLLGELDSISDGTWESDALSIHTPVDRSIRHESDGNHHRRGHDEDRRGGAADRRNHRPGYHIHNNRRDDRDLLDEVLQRERETAATSSKGGWARRPPTTKSALTSSSSTQGRRSVQDDHNTSHYNSKRKAQDYHRHPSDRQGERNNHSNHNRHHRDGGDTAAAAAPASRKRSAEENAAIEQKKRNLMAKYG